MKKIRLFDRILLILIFIVCFDNCFAQVSDSSENIDSLYKVVQKGLKGNPNNQYYYKAQGDILVLKGLINEAIESYNSAINIYPDYIDAISARGVAYYKESKYDNALRDFNYCISKSDSIHAEFYFNRALVYHDLKKYQEE